MSKTWIRRGAIGGVAVAGTAALMLPTLPVLASEAEPSPSSASTVGCELEELPDVADSNLSFGYSMDPTGEWVAGRTYPFDVAKPRIWHDGDSFQPEIPGGDIEPFGINSQGTVVGLTFSNASDGARAFAYDQNGEGAALARPEGAKDYWARDVNESGVIVGTGPVMWPSADEDPVALEIPEDEGATSGTAFGIRDDGVIVGSYKKSNVSTTAYMWDADGKGQPLPELDGEPVKGQASRIAGDWVIGEDGSGTPIAWNLAEGTATVIEDLDTVNNVNERGDFVGQRDGRAVLVTAEGEAVELPGLVDHDGEDYETARAISADGSTVMGNVVDEKGGQNYHATLWRCE